MKVNKGLLSRVATVGGLLVLLCGCGSARGFTTRQEPVLSVYEVVHERDANGAPLTSNRVVNLQGVLTSTPWSGTNHSIVHFQDETGGLVLVGRSRTAFSGFKEGQRVSVRGRVTQTRGMDEVLVEKIVAEGIGAMPKPRDVWTTDLLDETYAGQLVRVEGEIIPARRGAETIFLLRDQQGEIPLFLSAELLSWNNGQLNYRLWKGGKVKVTGIAGQDKATPPFDSGYGLIARTPRDFEFFPPPPAPASRTPFYVAIGVAIFLALLALDFWRRRRIAERRAEEVARLLHEIERSEAEVKKQAAFAQLNPNPVLEFFADGSITYANDAARDLAEAFGKPTVEDLLPPEVRRIIQECSDSRVAKLNCEVKIGPRTVSWSFFPIHEITSVHAYGYDITEQLNLEAQLRQSQKLESVGQLAAGIAHDFNNLLSVIQGYAGIAQMRNDLPQNTADALSEINLAAERAANLTRQLLTFSRRHSMEPRPVNLNDLTANVAKMLRRLLGEKISLKCQSTTDEGWVIGDPGMIEQIIVNLAVNARDAMDAGGELTVGISRHALTHADAEQRVEARPGEFICLSVSDTGCGMDDATAKRIFEPFFTTKEPGKGTGLGLATVHGIVKQHKGWVEVTTRKGQGTTFRVYLPSTAERAAIGADAARIPVTGGTESVLLVEDDAAVRKLARTVLQEYGYFVYDAATADEALAIWAQHGERIQLLLTDIVLPNAVTGWQLAQQLRARNHSLKIVFSTGSDLKELIPNKFAEEHELLRKPYKAQQLVTAVRKCLDTTTATSNW